MRLAARALIMAAVWAGAAATAQGTDALSLQEMALADCVGQALAVEQALDARAADGPWQVASARADALLQVAITRYVAISRAEAFRRRAALALAAESMRMDLAVQIAGGAERVIERTDREVEETCRHYMD